MADASKSSTAPLWIGGIVGALIGVSGGFLTLLIALPAGLAVGYVFYTRARGTHEHAAVQRRMDDLFERIAVLEYAVRRLSASAAAAAPPEGAAASAAAPGTDEATARPTSETFAAAAPEVEPVVASAAPPPTWRETAMPETVFEPPVPPAASAPVQPSPIAQAIAAARGWLLGGNTVARVGLLVLFIGVAFLLRYLAEHTRIPIELRLVGVALGGLVLLAFGWRLRAQRFGYAITLQGGAVGILYLTVFAALRLYGVLAPVPAFALLALIALLSGALAVLQNARALAALGATGGFLAPILVSTGSGRIELLLAYYLLLNLGVLGIAWFRAWRELNWIAFAFTFGVMGTWAFERYTPAQYAVGQSFLAAFWLLFFGVSLLYALRQSATRRGLFDTTLMFALPLAAFGIQTRFTEGVQLALAAVVASFAYLGGSALLLRRREAALAVLAEASFGVGVAFLTLAVPLAASAQWTAAAWALEGLALLWVGLRQRRVLPLVAGLLLHVAGAIALLRAVDSGAVMLQPQWSGLTVNLFVFACTAFGSSWLLARAVTVRASLGTRAVWLIDSLPFVLRLVGWAWVVVLVWQPLAYPWYPLAWCVLALVLLAVETRRSVDVSPEWVAGLTIVVTAWIATEVRAPLGDWLVGPVSMTTLLRLAVVATAVTGALMSLRGAPVRRTAAAGLLTLGVVAWLITLFAEAIARFDDRVAVAQLALLIVVVTAQLLAWLGRRLAWDWPIRLSWAQFGAHAALAALVVALAALEAALPSRHFGWFVWPLAWAAYYARLRWDSALTPSLPQPGAVHVAGLWLLTAMVSAEAALRVDAVAADGWFFAAWGALPALALWLVVHYALRWPMRAAPFAYATVGAPGLALFVLAWILVSSVATPADPAPLPYVPLVNPLDLATLLMLGAVLRWHLADHRPAWQSGIRWALGVIAFVALNAAALRAVHAFTGVPWDAVALGRSLVVQSVLSLLWTVTAMGVMVLANRRALRPLWVVGACLLGAVVLKLFFVDLAGQGTIEQIVSFVGVGLLILLIGYLAPVPPAAMAARSAS